MKVQEVILKAISGQLQWWQAAEILGVSCRTMRRWKARYQHHGYDGLFDRRRRRPSARRVPLQTAQQLLRLYREQYRDFHVAHFCDQLRAHHQSPLSYQWVKTALQTAGLVAPRSKRGPHRQRRPRRALRGMLLYVDGSAHAWLPDSASAQQDLIALIDDATSEVYCAFLVQEQGTMPVLAALREVIATHGLFCSLYTDRGGHFFHTPKAGGAVDKTQLTQIGRALAQLGIEHIPSYCPQGRGRMERFFGSWQGRLPQELRRVGARTIEQANRYIRQRFIPWHNRHWTEPAAQTGHAFVPCANVELDAILRAQHERVVAADNTVSIEGLRLQIAPQSSRWSFAKCRVKVCEQLDGTWTVRYGPHVLGRYRADGQALASGGKLKRAGGTTTTTTTKSGQITCYNQRPTSRVIDRKKTGSLPAHSSPCYLCLVRRAVIDIGTNTVKLLIADLHDQQIQPVIAKDITTRLGEGVDRSRHLHRVAIARTVQGIADFVADAREHGAIEIRAFTTAAARDADNRQEFLDAVRAKTGLAVEIITGQREAELIFRGVTGDPAFARDRLLVMDVGGGSAEFIQGKNGKMEKWKSLPLGAVRLMEKFPEFPALAEYLRTTLRRELAPLGAGLTGFDAPRLVATGGTNTTLVRILKGKVDHATFTLDEVRALVMKLNAMTLDQRRQVPGLPPERADIIVAGGAVVLFAMETLGAYELTVSIRNLRYGAML